MEWHFFIFSKIIWGRGEGPEEGWRGKGWGCSTFPHPNTYNYFKIRKKNRHSKIWDHYNLFGIKNWSYKILTWLHHEIRKCCLQKDVFDDISKSNEVINSNIGGIVDLYYIFHVWKFWIDIITRNKDIADNVYFEF